jgi:hypothetical protein
VYGLSWTGVYKARISGTDKNKNHTILRVRILYLIQSVPHGKMFNKKKSSSLKPVNHLKSKFGYNVSFYGSEIKDGHHH